MSQTPTSAPPPENDRHSRKIILSTPPLNECIKTMVSCLGNRSTLTTRHHADLTVAMVGYSAGLAVDLEKLSEFSRSYNCSNEANEDDTGSIVPFSEMPAIRELVTNPQLFHSMISLLSPSDHQSNLNTAGTLQPPSGHAQKMTQHMQNTNRKRSPSEDSTNSVNLSRKQKLLLSPKPPGNPINSKLHQSSSNADSQKNQHASMKVAPVLAASILYTALQHVDYWPIEVMKAFAEDSFGSRTWVDNERMKTLVSNLEASIVCASVSDESTVKRAEESEDYFTSLISQAEKMNGAATSTNGSPNRHRLLASSLQKLRKSPSSKQQRLQTKRVKSNDTSESSSSGEEEVLETESMITASKQKPPTTENLESTSCMSTASSSNSQHQESLHICYRSLRLLFRPSSLSKKRVRPRYIGHNLKLAHEAICDALSDRLNSKSKQNSRLLQILPSFVSIPRVRCLVSRHLERWLQSPALAGLARALFSKIVAEIQNIDPPLPDDVELIDNVIKMNLKSNQFSAHVENIKTIAKTIPTRAIAQQIFTHCLQGQPSSNANGARDHLHILFSVFTVLDQAVASEALASSVISITFNLIDGYSEHDVHMQFQEIRHILAMILDTIGPMYDGFVFVKTIIEVMKDKTEDKTAMTIASKLIFECMVLVSVAMPQLNHVFSDSRNGSLSLSIHDIDDESLLRFRRKLLALRKIVLGWYVTDVSKIVHDKIVREEASKCADVFDERGAVVRGPGKPDYGSALDGKLTMERDYHQPVFNHMLSSLRCLLFLSPPSSNEMQTFVNPQYLSSSQEMCTDQFRRIGFCCKYGVDVDDEMLQLVLKSPYLTNNSAIAIIENLVQNAAEIVGCKPDTVWAMYTLCEFVPELRQVNERAKIAEYSTDYEHLAERVGMKRKFNDGDLSSGKMFDLNNIPRLAHPHLWWRVTSIALVMCSIVPDEVGRSMWENHPTLQALMKMTTSQKYRFPTADCDERQRESIKRREEELREEEGNIAELLFMPPPKKVKKQRVEVSQPIPNGGSRFSTRQRAKQERMIALEHEKQEAEIRAENMKLKKLLRTVQKSIMIWDPKQDQRKPPKGSIDLLLSINERFDLAEKFRLCVEPDFLLKSIGEGRSAIERAYDWLIPVISSHPEIIDRLQPSASCFLLLRAYGVEGDNNRDLLDLTAPLLLHVSNCLTGTHGKTHAELAFDLLLQDLADENAERRRCARKVLQEAIGSVKEERSLPYQFGLGLCGWLFQLTYIENAKSVVPLAIKYLSHALAYERGKVLTIYVLALFEYTRFVKDHEVEISFDFVSSLCELMAQRPHVVSDALDRFPDLRLLAATEVKSAFDEALSSSSVEKEIKSPLVVMSLPRMKNDDVVEKLDISVPANLLQAAIILISNWQSSDIDEGEVNGSDGVRSKDEVMLCLMKYLIIPFAPKESEGKEFSGAASAMHKNSTLRAVTVEEWVLLAKARTDFVAKHAALSAPDIFLPRLLLCCGISNSSLITMLQRMENMAEQSADPAKTFNDLLSSSAVSQWGLPRIGGRKVIKRKLYGRITAYIRAGLKNAPKESMEELNIASESSFVSWLSSECKVVEGTKKQQLRSQPKATNYVKTISAESIEPEALENLVEDEVECMDVEYPEMTCTNGLIDDSPALLEESISHEFVKACLESGCCYHLDESLDHIMAKRLRKNLFHDISSAKILLSSIGLFHHDEYFVRIILKWVPLLTQFCGDDTLWKLMFIESFSDGSNLVLFDAIMSLVCNCAMRWSNEHINACQSWILSQQSKCSLARSIQSLKVSLRFLVISSEQKPIQCFDFENDANVPRLAYAQTQESTTSAIRLALDYLEIESGSKPIHCKTPLVETPIDRNNIPDWLILLVLVSKTSTQHLERTIDCILERSSKASYHTRSVVLLRLYTMFPLRMMLGESRLRHALLEASNNNHRPWIEWRCPLDDQVSEILCNITSSPHQRLCQSATDIAKQHPLILIRHLLLLKKRLIEDGSGMDGENQSLIKRGRIQGRPLEGDTVARVGSQDVTVSIVLWGYSFSEPVWTSVLDVLMSLPAEVAFTCGLKTGLHGVLEIYLKLLYTHIKILQTESNIERIREKFSMLLSSFASCKSNDFQNWAREKIPGWGAIGRLIDCCGMGHFLAAHQTPHDGNNS